MIRIEAITREEVLLQSIAEGKEVTLEPKTRLEWWLKKIAESGGSGGVRSWNDLTDKPFGKEVGEVTILETSLEPNEEAGMSFAGGSELPTPIVLGNTYTVHLDSGSYEAVCKEAIIDGNTFLYLGNMKLMGLDDTGETYYFLYPPSVDGYECGDFSSGSTLKITGESTIYNTISKEYLPSVAEQLSDISYTNVIEWDKDTTGKESFDNGDEIMYKVAEPPTNVTLEDLIGCKVTYNYKDGTTQETEYSDSFIMDMTSQFGVPGFIIASDVIIVLEDGEINGNTLTKGVYFAVNTSDVAMDYVSKLETVGNIFTTGTCDKIPEESIPELHHLILVSPNGTKFKIGISDTGEMTGSLYTE